MQTPIARRKENTRDDPFDCVPGRARDEVNDHDGRHVDRDVVYAHQARDEGVRDPLQSRKQTGEQQARDGEDGCTVQSEPDVEQPPAEQRIR